MLLTAPVVFSYTGDTGTDRMNTKSRDSPFMLFLLYSNSSFFLSTYQAVYENIAIS